MRTFKNLRSIIRNLFRKESRGRLFCSRPFKWFEVSGWYQPKGDVFVCCPSWLDTPVGNIQKQSTEEIWNGKTAQKIRRSILDGSFEYCNKERCPYLQTITGPVQTVDRVSDGDLKQVIENDLTVLPYGPIEINCTYDLSCNLSCPSCRTKKIIERENEKEILAIQERLKSHVLRDARMIYITGSGDAFGSPYFNHLLRTLDLRQMPNLERIHIHTNALLWTPGNWIRIPEPVQAKITTTEISIDAATPETYAVNRRGGQFAMLLRALDFISGLRRSGPLEFMKISMVVQENNFSEMPEFVKLGKKHGFDQVYFSKMVDWGTFQKSEFESRSICTKSHPRHLELVHLLKDEIFSESIVDLGNLTGLSENMNDPHPAR